MKKLKLFIIRNPYISIAHLLVFSTGLAFIVAANYFGDKLFPVFMSIGTSLVASFIVSIITYWFLTFENKLRDMVIKWGLADLYVTRSKMNEVSDELMKTSKKLDIIAFGLSSLRNSNYIDVLEERIKKGEIHIRILTLDPDSEQCPKIDVFEGETPSHTSETIKKLLEWANQFDKKNLEIRTYDSIPLEFYYCFDSDLFIGPHQATKISQETFTMRFSIGGIGSDIYLRYFEKLWESAKKDSLIC